MNEEEFDDACALCGQHQASESNLTEIVFHVNISSSKCGHRFCDRCIRREFARKTQFACPKCRTMVSEDKLSTKSLEETEVEKDYSVRRRLKSIFNKTATDFASDFVHKDYEELVEDLIYKVLNKIDVEETSRLIESYRQDNAKTIALNQHKRSEELRRELHSIASETELMASRLEEFQASSRVDLLQRQMSRKQNNQILLGEFEGTSISRNEVLATGKATEAANAPLLVAANNAALSLFQQRPEPKPVNSADLTVGRVPIRNARDLREMHRGGGYDHTNYERRNWDEIIGQLRVCMQ